MDNKDLIIETMTKQNADLMALVPDADKVQRRLDGDH